MKTYHKTYYTLLILLFAAFFGTQQRVYAETISEQELEDIATEVATLLNDSVNTDSLTALAGDTARINRIIEQNQDIIATGIETAKRHWIPEPQKALWMALVFPGAGQIYNRKYWKLPIFYGGFLGCVYALSWNNTMYRDYSQAYIDIMDSDPNTKSYMNFIPASYDVNANMDRLKELFRRKKDFYRRYRDLSMFCMIGVYLLSVVDAYVDAELSSFDISKDISLKVKPTIINDRQRFMAGSGINGSSYGVQCSFNF